MPASGILQKGEVFWSYSAGCLRNRSPGLHIG